MLARSSRLAAIAALSSFALAASAPLAAAQSATAPFTAAPRASHQLAAQSPSATPASDSSTPIADGTTAPLVGPAVPPPSADAPSIDRAKFSGGRMVVEILTGALVGSLAGYGTYESLCSSGSDCLGAGLAGAGMNFLVTPLAVWGVGRWMGGKGTLGMTYLGASLALTPLSVPGSADESASDTANRIGIEFAISTFLLPVTSALTFELSSHVKWRAMQRGNATVAVTPVHDARGNLDGAVAGFALRF